MRRKGEVSSLSYTAPANSVWSNYELWSQNYSDA